MNRMNFMEKLLDGVAIEWKALEEVANFANGKGHEKDIFEEGKYIVVNSKFISTEGRVAKYSDKQICPLFIDDILIVMSDLPNGKALAKTFIVDMDEKYTLNQRIGAISVKNSDKLLPKFLHIILNRSTQLTKYDNGIDQTNLRKDQILGVQIPIPCPENPRKSLEIQAEIVRILDAFTDLTTELIAELTAELTARKKQYRHYRDQLLSFEDGEVEWRALEEVILPTSNIRWRDTKRSYHYIDLASVNRESNSIVETIEINAQNAPSRAQKVVEKNDVIFATTRPTQLRLSLINDEYSGEIASTGYCVLRAKSYLVLPKWIYFHLSSSEFFNYVEENQSGSAYPAISDSKVKEFKLPIPHPNDPEKSIAEQARIVAILDKFDALSKTISAGLSREIELRQKQYEYYRDLLLSFPKLEEVVT